MIRNLGWPALVTALLCAPVAFPSGDDGEQKGESMLVRPPGAPDDDAKGKVEIEHHDGEYEEAFEVEAEHLDPFGTYEVFLEDGPSSGVLVSIGFLSYSGSSDPSGDDGDDDDDGDDEDEEEFELEFDTDDGDSLPFGVTFASELSGRAIEVRSGGQVYLEGVVPALGDGEGDKSKVKWQLARPPLPPDADATGEVELKADGAELEFEVEAEHVDTTSVVFSVWVEDAVGSGVFQSVGAMGVKKASIEGEAKLELETEHGESLPFGAADLGALAGRMLEVRGDGGQTYLVGKVPEFGAATVKAAASLAGDGKGRVKVRRKGKTGAQDFRLKLKKLAKKAPIEVWIENPASGTLELAATLKTKKSGRAAWKLRTKKGHPLPHGVLTIDALGGRPVEIREVATGAVLLTGVVPTPD